MYSGHEEPGRVSVSVTGSMTWNSEASGTPGEHDRIGADADGQGQHDDGAQDGGPHERTERVPGFTHGLFDHGCEVCAAYLIWGRATWRAMVLRGDGWRAYNRRPWARTRRPDATTPAPVAAARSSRSAAAPAANGGASQQPSPPSSSAAWSWLLSCSGSHPTDGKAAPRQRRAGRGHPSTAIGTEHVARCLHGGLA
jgi:hypothetical protein